MELPDQGGIEPIIIFFLFFVVIVFLAYNGGEAEDLPLEGRPHPIEELRRQLAGVPLRGQQADGGDPGLRVGEVNPSAAPPPPQRLLRRLRRHGLHGQQGQRRPLTIDSPPHLLPL